VRRASKLVILATLGACATLAGCAPAAPVAPTNAGDEDIGVPLAGGDASIAIDTSSLKAPLHGAVTSIAAVANSPEWFDFVLAGSDAPETRTLRLASKGRLPFTVGDVLDVAVTKHVIGFAAWALEVEVRDAAGKLWAALYTTLGEHGDWSFDALAGSDTMPCRVAITRTLGAERHRAVVPTGDSRKIELEDGAWGASASCPGPYPGPPGGPPIPDWSPDPTVVQISRLLR
jgi:hypothetical protein